MGRVLFAEGRAANNAQVQLFFKPRFPRTGFWGSWGAAAALGDSEQLSCCRELGHGAGTEELRPLYKVALLFCAMEQKRVSG